MGALANAPHVLMESRDAWRAWLMEHHATSPGVWLVTWKRGSGHPVLEYDDVVEELLCVGWIDGQTGSVDAERRRLYVSPRRPKGVWARTNKERVERLAAAGLLLPAGIAAIERAKTNGAWEALDAVDALELPADLVAALDAAPGARATWESFSPSVRRMGLGWVLAAKRPETRAARVSDVADSASRGLKPAPARPREEPRASS